MSRFDRLAAELAAKGAHDPDALAAYIGRKKYGREAFAAMAAAGRKKGRAESLRADPTGMSRLRSYPIQDFAVRADGDGRIVDAYAAVFDVPAEVRDQDGHYNEVLAPGSFDKTIAERGENLLVLYNHGRSLYGTPDGQLSVPIGVPVEAPRSDGVGVMTSTRYLDNPLADSVLDAIKQRAIRGQSFTGRFIKSTRVRSSEPGGLPTITRAEVAMSEYGPTPIPVYREAEILGTRSAEMWMTELLRMDPQARADLFAQMVALATPLKPAEPEPAREAVVVSARSDAADSADPAEEAAPQDAATPATEPAVDQPTATAAGHDAEEPHTHSARHADIKRRARVARIAHGRAK